MAKLPQLFNHEGNKEGLDDFSAMPKGDYLVTITKSEYKPTKANTGHYLQLMMKVAEWKFKGRVIFARLNLDNPNPVAVEISTKELNSICQACGKAAVEDSNELHGIPFYIAVTVKPATGSYPESNEIANYKSASAAASLPAETHSDPVKESENPAPPEDAASTKQVSTSPDKLPWE